MVFSTAVLLQAVLSRLIIPPVAEMTVNLPLLVLARVWSPRLSCTARRLVVAVAARYSVYRRRGRVQSPAP